MTNTITIIFFLLGLNLFSQDNFWYEKGNIISEYSEFKNNTKAFKYQTLSSENTFTVSINGTDSMRVQHFFRPYNDGSFNEESLCDSLIIELLCQKCIDQHLSKLIKSKERKWRKTTDSIYISSKAVGKYPYRGKLPTKFMVPMMKINSSEKITTITIYPLMFTKQEWREMKSFSKVK